MKYWILATTTAIGVAITNLLGGVDMALQLLLLLMVIDFITGVMIAVVFKKSKKSVNGAVSSVSAFQGICKKAVMLFIVIVAANVDLLFGVEQTRYVTIMFFVAIEFFSIVENAGLMGVPIPQKIKNIFDVLKEDDKNVQSD